MTTNFNDFWSSYNSRIEEQRQQLPRLKRLVFGVLSTHCIATVTVCYDGEGDSGQTGEIAALDANGSSVDLTTLRLGKEDTAQLSELLKMHAQVPTLFGLLDAFTWEILAAYHAGFVNNDGGFGTLCIDVAGGTITLDHNDRYVEFHPSTTEL